MMAGNFLQRKEEPFDPQVMIGSEGAVGAVAAEEAEDEI
jgi:hypothetical protein